MLLPRVESSDAEEDDPRAELVRRLQEYERFKKAAEDLDELPRVGRDIAVAQAWVEDRATIRVPPDVELRELLLALSDVLNRADLFSRHHIQREPLSVRERMSRIVDALRDEPFREFHTLFTIEEGRMGVVVTFIALLELLKMQLVELVQNEPCGQIYIKSLTAKE
jgi:segregation and condensation protein A